MNRLFFALSLSLLCTLSAWAVTVPSPPEPGVLPEPPVSIDASGQRLDPGFKLNIMFVSPISSDTSRVGDSFLAKTQDDLWVGDQLILPKGVTLRGRIDAVQKPGFFSKGGLIRLSFDHLLSPTGELQPVSLDVDASSAKMSRQRNALYTDPGIGKKLDQSLDAGIDTFKAFHQHGLDYAKEKGGFIGAVGVPLGTTAGIVSGTATTAGQSVKAVFGRGESIVVQPGDVFTLTLTRPVLLQGQ